MLPTTKLRSKINDKRSSINACTVAVLTTLELRSYQNFLSSKTELRKNEEKNSVLRRLSGRKDFGLYNTRDGVKRRFVLCPHPVPLENPENLVLLALCNAECSGKMPYGATV
jgi:hypothetical protein